MMTMTQAKREALKARHAEIAAARANRAIIERCARHYIAAIFTAR